MTELLITIENPADEALLVALANRLNAHVTRKPELPPRPDAQAMVQALKKIADNGSFSYMADPIAWQREMRQDRALPFSE